MRELLDRELLPYTEGIERILNVWKGKNVEVVL
jgi:hypothetical protein